MSDAITRALATALQDALPYLTRLGYQTSVHDPVNRVQAAAVSALNWYAEHEDYDTDTCRCRECGATFRVPAIARCPECTSTYLARVRSHSPLQEEG